MSCKFLNNELICLQLNVRTLKRSRFTPFDTHRLIYTELKKLCNVLYCSSNNMQSIAFSFNRYNPNLQLILSSKNITTLSHIVYNIRGICMARGSQKDDKLTMGSLYQQLRESWNNKRPDSDIMIGPWIFSKSPSDFLLTTNNEKISINLNDSPLRHSQDNTYKSHSLSEPVIGNEAIVRLEWEHFNNFDSLPDSMRRWLYGFDRRNDFNEMTKMNSRDSQRLDILLNGFKKF
ncbi:hypothetical protein KAFR_0A05300 [Kazachstania africana CBS 2517]|uniref:Uncharacterized protein n=1 Tax=Kazachstania africana (strain ATCC 22294 / BCRC 22015 / CBS 2517 / CECT 1963 / NBRC 1671 / NRRL Y-8276) TaxID=1071382 RepID=H2ANL5_KAZAF|nr:hypothetical protein KAFR_0A05300 [Kazachstania africana CBS 2517]CCF55965.1 hypothetical protein KAFR_0A05300 [Kazachstania africana CBS 2517]